MWELVNEIKTALAGISDINTSRIGVEVGIGAKDCPAARVDPEVRSANDKYYNGGKMQILILVDAKNDLELAYQSLFDIEEQAIVALRGVSALLSDPDTQYDLNSVANFKSCILVYNYRIKNGDERACR